MDDKLQFITSVLFGFFLSVAVHRVSRQGISQLIQQLTGKHCVKLHHEGFGEDSKFVNVTSNRKGTREFMFVGILTSDELIHSRGQAIYDTWAKTIPAKVLFFIEENTTYTGDLPVVRLKGVPSREYPPQRKSFYMFQYMYQRYRNQYEWFFRADDDLYVKGDRIEKLLRSVNSSKAWYIGQSSWGSFKELHKLGLLNGQPFCMGGTGVFLSHVTLSNFVPHIPECMTSVITNHEDTELGRCIQKSLGIGCTTAFENIQYFYHNYKDKNESFTLDLGIDEEKAYTVHPFKRPAYLYRFHNFISYGRVRNHKFKEVKLQEEIYATAKYIQLTEKHGISNIQPMAERDDPSTIWQYFGKGLFSPNRSFSAHPKAILDEEKISQLVFDGVRKTFPHTWMKLNKHQFSYLKVSPLDGAKWRMSQMMSYMSKSKNVQKVIVPLSFEQKFSQLEFFEGKDNFRAFVPKPEKIPPIRMLIPVKAEAAILEQFIIKHIYLLANHYIATVVFVVFHDKIDENIKGVDSVKMSYPFFDIRIINLSAYRFCRASAIAAGANMFLNDESLLISMNVNMVFTAEFLDRLQKNTINGRQVYFPVYLSPLNPKMKRYSKLNGSGIWRLNDFTIFGIYQSDYHAIAGLNETGLNCDTTGVEFYQRTLELSFRVFRSTDTGIIVNSYSHFTVDL